MAFHCEWFMFLLVFIAHAQCSCNEGAPCTTPEGLNGVCMNADCKLIPADRRIHQSFAVVIKYPEEALQAHGGINLYMRGNALGFNWKTGVKLNKVTKDTWRTVVIYQSTVDGFRCQDCGANSIFTDGNFEYRIFIDDNTNMIGGNFQIKLPISKSSKYFSDIPEFLEYPWFYAKTGQRSMFSVESPQLLRNFSVLIHKPPSFMENTYKIYPTVIVFDLTESMHNITRHLFDDPIVETGTIGESILIGFGDFLSPGDRLDLLSQVSGNWYTCINGTTIDGCGGCVPAGVNFTTYVWYMEYRCGQPVMNVGGKGNDTLDFIVDAVVPRAQEIANMRMLTDQSNFGIMGFSLGGLMACHAAWTRPEIFGFASCQSPSFWWPYVNFTHSSSFFNTVTLKDETLLHNRPYQKIYLDVGENEPGSPFGMVRNMLNAARVMGSTSAYHWDRNLWAFVYPDYPHEYLYWEMRMWHPLKLFFPTSPAPIFDSLCNEKVSGSWRNQFSGSWRNQFSVSMVLLYSLVACFVQSLAIV